MGVRDDSAHGILDEAGKIGCCGTAGGKAHGAGAKHESEKGKSDES